MHIFYCRVVLVHQVEMEPPVLLVRKATQDLMVNLEMMATQVHMVPQEDQEGALIDQAKKEHLVKTDTQEET